MWKSDAVDVPERNVVVTAGRTAVCTELARRLVRLLEPVVAEVEDVVVAGAPQDGYGHQSKLDVDVVIAAVGMAVACLAKWGFSMPDSVDVLG